MLFLLLLTCIGTVTGRSRIIGGHDTNTHHHPHQAALTVNNGFLICGASIVHEFWVLTAAHCVDGGSPSQYRIEINDGSRHDPNRIEFEVIEIVKHPNYNHGPGALPNDLALLRTRNSLTASSHHKVIQMVDESDGNFANHNCHITGWGYTDDSMVTPTQLQESGGKVMSDGECNAEWGPNYTGSKHICIHNALSGSCNGDSGGPMVCSHKLAGVMSWMAQDCLTEYPSVYVRVTNYHSWIMSVISAS